MMRGKPGGRSWKGRGRILTNAILLIIAEKPNYGYDIANKLDELGIERIEGIGQMGKIYRILSDLENNGYIISEWDVSSSPPKKVYKITPVGLDYLRYSLEVMKKEEKFLNNFIEKCERVLKKKD